MLSLLGATVVGSGVATGASGDGSDPAEAPETTPTGTEASTTTGTDQRTRPPIGSHLTSGVTPARTGYDADESGPRAPISRRWCVGTDVANRQSAVAVVDGTVLSATPEGLRALDARSGERQWGAEIDGGPPTVREGRVYVGTHSVVSCLGFESGRELWARRLSNVTGRPLVLDVDTQGTRVFAVTERTEDDGATDGAVLHALDASTGETAYRISADTTAMYGHLAGRGTHVYGGTTTGSVVAFDVGAHEVAWQANLGEYVSSVAVTDETVFAGSHTGVVAALDRTTGDERWAVTLDGAEVAVRARPAVAMGTVYVAATDGNLYAFDRDTGDERWRFDGGGRLGQPPAVVGSDDDRSVVFGSDAGNVFSLDAASGDMGWTHQLRERVNTPPVVVDGVVYIGDDAGRLYALANEDSNIGSEGGSCRTPAAEGTERGRGDSDDDGVVNSRDYAPRDGSVQRKGDLRNRYGDRSSEDEGESILFGAGVGAGISLSGVGLGYALWGRSAGEADDP
ncbi:MAG: PQQ-binding-like beta-propeller repeat protein [Haloferacaceae archaeon]